jgi:hypothetical protein
VDRQIDVAQHMKSAVPLVHLGDLDRDLGRDLHFGAVDFAFRDEF